MVTPALLKRWRRMLHAPSVSADGEPDRVDVASIHSPSTTFSSVQRRCCCSSMHCSWRGRKWGAMLPCLPLHSPHECDEDHTEKRPWGTSALVLFPRWLTSSGPVKHLHQIVVLQFWASSVWGSCSVWLLCACVHTWETIRKRKWD